MRPLVSMRDALADDRLLGRALPGPSWAVWRALLIAANGEALTDDERALFRLVTGREHEPLQPVEEQTVIAGRRSGKTRASATQGVYWACLCDHTASLAPGETGTLPILSASTAQAARAFEHALGIIGDSPALCGQVEATTSDTIKLRGQVEIKIRPANFRTIRGLTAIGAIADEIAFWQIEGAANPDKEILAAIRPALATTGGQLLMVSSPYGKRGELYQSFRRDYGPSGDPLILVAKGASRTFNPSLPERVVARAYERDTAAALAEFGGEFRADVEVYASLEVVMACVTAGMRERAPVTGRRYFGFADPSGGASDSFTLAIAHAEGERVVIDAVRERRPPFSPDGVVAEYAATLKRYGVYKVIGDRYGGDWPRERFRSHGISYEPAERTKSELFGALLPLLNSGTIDLIDDGARPGEVGRLVGQIAGLERRTSPGGRELIGKPAGFGAHDDLANAVAGVAALASRPIQQVIVRRLRI